MRNNQWLEQKLEEIWNRAFADIPRMNQIKIHFGRKAKRRLASIRQLNRHLKNSDTEIKVTGYFRDPNIPEFIVDVTIAHELCHYAHGFASPLPQFSRFPHRGDLVDKELLKRGFGKELKAQDAWLKENWNGIVNDRVFLPKKSQKTRPAQKQSFSLIKYIFGIN